MVILKITYRTVLSLCMVCLLLYCASTASAQPMLPHAFYGTVTIGGQPAPLDTLVTAKVNGIESGNVTTWQVGEYGWGLGIPNEEYQGNLLVQGEHISGGDTIEFYINNFKADQTATFDSGEFTELDLTVDYAPPITPTITPTPSPTVTPTPSPTPTVTPTPTPTPTPTTPPDGGGGLSGGAVAGIAVGALIVGAVIVWLIMRRQKGASTSSPAP